LNFSFATFEIMSNFQNADDLEGIVDLNDGEKAENNIHERLRSNFIPSSLVKKLSWQRVGYVFILLLIFLFVTGILSLIIYSLIRPDTNQLNPPNVLQQLYVEEWAMRLSLNPEFATLMNDKQYNGQLTNYSLDSITAYNQYYTELKGKVDGLVRQLTLSTTTMSASTGTIIVNQTTLLSAQVFQRLINNIVEAIPFNESYLNIDHLENGPQIEFPNLIQDTPFGILKDYEDFLSRLTMFPIQIDERIILMKKGIATGITKPRITLIGIPAQVRHLINVPVVSSVFYNPFLKFPSDITVDQQQQLRSKAVDIISKNVYPAYQKLLEFMENEYIPQSRTTIAARDLPGGEAYYKFLLKFHTTLPSDPEQIHQLGLSEVSRINGLMQSIIRNQIGYNGTTIQEFFSFMKNQTRFYKKTEEDFLMFIGNIGKRADPELPKLFGRLPSCPWGVKPMEKEQAKTAPAARYNGPNMDCSRPGWFYVNTYDISQRPLYLYESLTLHEGVPGHHLQIAIANELPGLPKFRTVDLAEFTAFAEGWGLYSEGLGEQMGFYGDPYFKLGALGNEIFRACRLVLDTGIHWKNWTRQQSIDFMLQNTPLPILDVIAEVDRYITWPGQATAYKMGQLKITQLRNLAKETLLGKFDIRQFHDVILGSGALPMDLLEANVKQYINSQSQL